MNGRYIISFIDVIMLVLMGIVVLFVLSLILINPPAKKADIDSEDKYMVVLEWDTTSDSDIDLHLLTPEGRVGFNNRQNRLAYQDKDDLGKISDGGKVPVNREVIYIKRRQTGFYVANVHVYAKRNYNGPENIRVTFYQIKPVFMELFSKRIPELEQGQEYTAFTFRIQDTEPYIFFDDTVQLSIIVENKNE